MFSVFLDVNSRIAGMQIIGCLDLSGWSLTGIHYYHLGPNWIGSGHWKWFQTLWPNPCPLIQMEIINGGLEGIPIRNFLSAIGFFRLFERFAGDLYGIFGSICPSDRSTSLNPRTNCRTRSENRENPSNPKIGASKLYATFGKRNCALLVGVFGITICI